MSNADGSPMFTHETNDETVIGLDESGKIVTVTKPDGTTATFAAHEFDRIILGYWWVMTDQRIARAAEQEFGTESVKPTSLFRRFIAELCIKDTAERIANLLDEYRRGV